MNKKEIEQSILLSAKQFLVEALHNYKDGKRNFAILHAVTAVELALKERLRRINPSLLFKNIDAVDFRGEKTLELSKVPQRLANLGVQIDQKNIELILLFAQWRNEIVHHMPTFDIKTVDRQFPVLLDFFSAFIREELNVTLESFLPKQLFRTASSLLKEWKRVVEEAQGRAKRAGNVLPEACPTCGADGVLCLREGSRVFCQLCSAKHYHYDYCTKCERKTVSSFTAFDDGNLCDDCLNAEADAYADMMSDIERGR